MKEIKLPPSENEIGYTNKEILDILKPYKIKPNTFWSKFGINTCGRDEKTGESLIYGCDIELAIRCCLERREKTLWEFD